MHANTLLFALENKTALETTTFRNLEFGISKGLSKGFRHDLISLFYKVDAMLIFSAIACDLWSFRRFFYRVKIMIFVNSFIYIFYGCRNLRAFAAESRILSFLDL
jgi:hypothetical protein